MRFQQAEWNEKMRMRTLICSVAALVVISSVPALAQFDDSTGGDGEVEALYDQIEEKEEKRRPIPGRGTTPEKSEANSLSDLADLAPFSDVAVISRKFLPKTQRFEASASLALGLNNEFFTPVGGGLRGGYYFTERYGLEFAYYFLTDIEKDITTKLRERLSVKTRSLVRPQGFGALTFKWAPIYGKMSFLDRSIIPYDLYFQAGLGYAQTAEGASPGVSAGAGQLFALTKSLAVRWDFTWNYYQANVRMTTGLVTSEKKTNHSDILVAIGVSYFWPEASYR